MLLLSVNLCSESDFMETAQTSGVWLASCLDVGQNELIRDSKSSCSVVGVLVFLDLCMVPLTQELASVRKGVSASVTPFPEASAETDHRQSAAPSAPAKQNGLSPPMFPMERPSLIWTHASTEQWGHGQVSSQGWSHSLCVWMYLYVWCIWSHND